MLTRGIVERRGIYRLMMLGKTLLMSDTTERIESISAGGEIIDL